VHRACCSSGHSRRGYSTSHNVPHVVHCHSEGLKRPRFLFGPWRLSHWSIVTVAVCQRSRKSRSGPPGVRSPDLTEPFNGGRSQNVHLIQPVTSLDFFHVLPEQLHVPLFVVCLEQRLPCVPKMATRPGGAITEGRRGDTVWGGMVEGLMPVTRCKHP